MWTNVSKNYIKSYTGGLNISITMFFTSMRYVITKRSVDLVANANRHKRRMNWFIHHQPLWIKIIHKIKWLTLKAKHLVITVINNAKQKNKTRGLKVDPRKHKFTNCQLSQDWNILTDIPTQWTHFELAYKHSRNAS